MNAAMLMLVASTFAAPHAPSTFTTPSSRLMSHTTFVTAADGSFVQPGAKPKGTVAGKAFTLSVQGGLVTGIGSSGFIVGVGASMQPGHNEHVELMGDVNFGRAGGGTVVYVSFNGIYDLKKTDGGMTPFVGGGLSIFHFNYGFNDSFCGIAGVDCNFGATTTSLQLLAGIQLHSNSEHVMRLSVRFLLNGGTPIILLFGYSF